MNLMKADWFYNAFVNGSLVGCQRSNPEPIKAPDGKDGEGDGE